MTQKLRVFVDTSVLLATLDRSQPVHQQQAQRWIRELWIRGCLRTSVQVLAEFATHASRLQRGLTSNQLADYLAVFLTWQPAAMGTQTLMRAWQLTQDDQLAWWDALAVASAQEQACDVLLSEAFPHGAKLGGVLCQNPFLIGDPPAGVVPAVHEEPAPYSSPFRVTQAA